MNWEAGRELKGLFELLNDIGQRAHRLLLHVRFNTKRGTQYLAIKQLRGSRLVQIADY